MEDKKNLKWLVVVILLIIIIVLAGCLIAQNIKKGNNSADNNKTNVEAVEKEEPKEEQKEEPKEEKQEEASEVDIEDAKVIEELSKKTNIILSMGDQVSSDRVTKLNGFYMFYESLNFTSEEKLYMAVQVNSDKREKINKKLYDAKIKKYYEKTENELLAPGEIEEDGVITAIIDGTIVKETYSYLFDDVDRIMQKDGETLGCPEYFYIKDTNSFVEIQNCGGTGEPFYYINQYKITQKGDYAYVYFAVIKLDPYDEYSVFSGLELSDAPSKRIEKFDENKDYAKEIKDNYDKYAKYVFTFKKDNKGNYTYQEGKSL